MSESIGKIFKGESEVAQAKQSGLPEIVLGKVMERLGRGDVTGFVCVIFGEDGPTVSAMADQDQIIEAGEIIGEHVGSADCRLAPGFMGAVQQGVAAGLAQQLAKAMGLPPDVQVHII